MMLTEFQCDDCGAHVSAFQPVKPAWQRCATCTWISENVLPEDESAVRARLGVPLIAPDDRSAA
jgi:rubredoxin